MSKLLKEDVARLLREIAASDAVLVGGQSISIWADFWLLEWTHVDCSSRLNALPALQLKTQR